MRSLAAPLVLLIFASPAVGREKDRPPDQEAPRSRGKLIEGIRCRSDPSQTYTLYLPTSYTTERAWPALLVLDPRGRSVRAAELFRQAAEEYGWILLSSNDTRSDGPMEPNVRAMQALWPEVHERYATDPERIYLAGFSGGGMLAWEVGRKTGRVAGVIAAGGRWLKEHFDQRISFPCFGAAGNVDFNYDQMKTLHARLREWGTPERLEIFEGPHSWMPVELARLGVEWMEGQAMKRGLRPKDEALVARLLSRDLARAAELEAEGRPLDAWRRYEATAATFDGLAPVGDARREAERLSALPATARAVEDERRWDEYERKMVASRQDVYSKLIGAEPPFLLAAYRADFRLDELLGRAEAEGYEGVVGRRLLLSLATQTGFYMPREFMPRGDYGRAALALALATEAAPGRPDLWYNLACARARVGAEREALDALEKAVATGFTNRDFMAADEDLKSLHDEARFQALVRPGAGETASP